MDILELILKRKTVQNIKKWRGTFSVELHERKKFCLRIFSISHIFGRVKIFIFRKTVTTLFWKSKILIFLTNTWDKKSPKTKMFFSKSPTKISVENTQKRLCNISRNGSFIFKIFSISHIFWEKYKNFNFFENGRHPFLKTKDFNFFNKYVRYRKSLKAKMFFPKSILKVIFNFLLFRTKEFLKKPALFLKSSIF